jgi:hypothetical protein
VSLTVDAPTNPPLHVRLYHVWRIADLRIVGGGRGGPWSRGHCACCGEGVWYQRPHKEDRVLVCWVCDPT